MTRRSRYPLDPGWRPPERMMQGAPVVEDYEVIEEGEDWHIRGILFGGADPRFEDGAQITTGVIQAFDEAEGWAISYSGGYRLGARRNGGDDA
ncbi:hypothetical protein [Microvirga yunnanensis]|uniref:hypothetical protein n=1 Tax=Microvirga yunnanensis TaxID=2953740 RepID=UPI0021C614CC|nr:hypothetical protein [Microvirga sp. HBU67655]